MKATAAKPQASAFEHLKKTDKEFGDYWNAKELSKFLGYSHYKDFLPAIQKARIACKNAGQSLEDHFHDAVEIRETNGEARRKLYSIRLSRYACYLVVLNADPNNVVVAKGQTYLAAQARLAELKGDIEYQMLSTEVNRRKFLRRQLARHNTSLSSAAKKAGVSKPEDFASFQNHGYRGLYGGLDASDIRDQKGLAKGDNILDYMGSMELSANLERVIQTERKLKEERISGTINASSAHFATGQKVREALLREKGVLPEQLPIAPEVSQDES